MWRSFPLVVSLSRAAAAALLTIPSSLHAQQARARHFRVPLDSGAVHVAVTSRAASVTVVAPTGTFLKAFSTDAALTAWANAAAALPRDSAASLSSESDRSPNDVTDVQLIRVDGDSLRYRLDATNSAWTASLPVAPAQAAMLFAVLRGDSAAGATPLNNATVTSSGEGDRPDEFGAWITAQLDRDAMPKRAPRSPKYPSSLRGSGVSGTVRLWFLVDSTGRVQPSSIRLLGKAAPALAVAARDEMLRMAFDPARRKGKPVSQILIQEFVYDGH